MTEAYIKVDVGTGCLLRANCAHWSVTTSSAIGIKVADNAKSTISEREPK